MKTVRFTLVTEIAGQATPSRRQVFPFRSLVAKNAVSVPAISDMPVSAHQSAEAPDPRRRKARGFSLTRSSREEAIINKKTGSYKG